MDFLQDMLRKMAAAPLPMAADWNDRAEWESNFSEALAHEHSGDAHGAEAFFKRAVALSKGQAGPERRQSLLGLAGLLREQRRYREAEPLYREGLALWERVPGRDEELAAHLHNLSVTLFNSGQPAEAEPIVKRALALKQELYGPESPEVAFALEGVVATLNAQQKWDEAVVHYQRMKEIRNEPFDGSMPI
jgi:tetratricopeptide (TPR) repeat protein